MRIVIVSALCLLLATTAIAGRIPGDAVPKPYGAMAEKASSFTFENFTMAGSYFALVDPDPVVGVIEGVNGLFTLVDDGLNWTYCSDLCVLFANADLSAIYLQIGGFSTYADSINKYNWPNGDSDVAGTQGGGTVMLNAPMDVSGMYMWLGNGYGSGGDGVWTGQIDLLGSVVDNDNSSWGEVKALFR
jgi:hypothetical protein